MAINSDITDFVNSLTTNDFPTGDVSNAITSSLRYISGKIGRTITEDTTEDNEITVIAMLSSAMLHEGRRTIKSRTENIVVRTIDKLFTQEMYDMLVIGDVQSPNLIRVKDITPTQSW